MFCTSGSVDGVIFSRNGQAEATRIGRMLTVGGGRTGAGRSLLPTVQCMTCVDWRRAARRAVGAGSCEVERKPRHGARHARPHRRAPAV